MFVDVLLFQFVQDHVADRLLKRVDVELRLVCAMGRHGQQPDEHRHHAKQREHPSSKSRDEMIHASAVGMLPMGDCGGVVPPPITGGREEFLALFAK